tara:strand:+ start:114 stop:557 length:444 start_codon:yes stop_codon:yes gene_type:complete
MSKTTPNKSGSRHVRSRKHDAAIKEAKLVFDATWEAVMAADDEDLDAVCAAIDAAKAKHTDRLVKPLAKLPTTREATGLKVFHVVATEPAPRKRVVNRRLMMKEFGTNNNPVTNKDRTRPNFVRDWSISSIRHITTKSGSDDDRDWL